MNAERALYDDPAVLELSRKRALADIAAGRVVPNEVVTDWLKTWGTADEVPIPDEYRAFPSSIQKFRYGSRDGRGVA